MASNPRLIDLSGMRFGKWSVLEKNGNAPRGGAIWRCACDCGTTKDVFGADLRAGKSLSCGCAGSRATMGERRRQHGLTGTRLYHCWKGMHARCRNMEQPNYGGKGITVCDEWSEFSVFKKWADAAGYDDLLTIERINSNGNYCPANCTWADRTQQARNRSIVRMAPDGRSWAEIASEHGIPTHVMNTRINAGGWPPEIAATWPLGKRRTIRARTEAGQWASSEPTWRR